MQQDTKVIRNEIIRYSIYLLIVLGLTVLAFYLTIGNNANIIVDTLKSANPYFILAVLGVVLFCFILRSIVIFFLTRSYEKKYPFHRAIAVDQVGTFYRMVTPAGLGSHVMETHTYFRQRIPISTALSILATYSIIYQIVLIIYNTITIIAKGNLIVEIGFINISFSESTNVDVPLWILIMIGYVINLAVIVFIFFISYWNGFYHFLDKKCGKLFYKLKIVKNLDNYHQKLTGARDNFRANFGHLLVNWRVFIISIVAFFLYITLSYSVPYIVGLALGNSSQYANFWDSVLLSNFHQMITCIIPIPGNSLLSELFFLRLFYPAGSAVKFYESEEIARASLLLWRGLMFIIPLFISSLFTIIYRPRKNAYYAQDSNDQEVQE